MQRFATLMALCAALVLGAGSSRAEYPEQPIRLVIPYPPGTGTDALARFTARKLEERLGKPVIPENRPGSSGIVAAQAVIASPPDGHTLFFVANAPVATNVALFSRLPYDPVKDLTPIARLAQGSFGLLVPADSPYRSARVPRSTVEKLERTLLEIFATEEAQQFLAKNNLFPFSGDAQVLRQYQQADIEREMRIIEQAKIPKQ